MAPMQKRAWWGLGAGLVFAAAFIIVFFTMGGIARFDSNTNFRLIIDALAIGALVINLVVVNVPMRWRGMADERDIKIIDWAPRVQWLAVIFTLVAWTIGLTERYHATGLVPSVYLYVLFLSVLIVSTIAQSAGILLGYWRMDRNG
jgi:hypothetical protein